MTTIDLETAKTTEQAAEALGVSPSKLRDFMTKNEITVVKWGTQNVFTPEDMTRIRGLMDGRCPNCGWKKGDEVLPSDPNVAENKPEPA
ncbi:MAG: helix-turn-helix domain-containing protein, partial [bacterium]|nr:helix-turn-helix domain-containing protein [bacterium]